MFKTVFANSNYSISLDGIIQDKLTYKKLPIIDGVVYIELYNENKYVDFEWLALMSHFEISLRSITKEDISVIKFKKLSCNKILKFKCGHHMVFDKPIYFKPLKYFEKYRIVPNFTRYAVSIDGEVIDTHFDEIVKQIVADYISVFIYDPDRGRYRSITLHRLIAMAWIEGMGENEAYIVNHKDGNKLNLSINNLEWVTVSQNNIHAFKNGLRTDNINCVVKVISTNEEHEFCSVTDACKFMGLTGCISLPLLKNNKCSALIKKGFEFRTKDDLYPWVVTKSFKDNKLGFLYIKVLYPDGTLEEFGSSLQFKKHFKLWNLKNNTIQALITELNKRRDDLIITYEDSRIKDSYQAMRLSDMCIFESDTIRGLANITNVLFPTILYCIRKYPNGNYISGDYVFRIKSDKPFDISLASIRKNLNKEIMAIDTTNNTIMEFNSLRECSDHYGIDRSVVKRCVLNKSMFKNISFVLNNTI